MIRSNAANLNARCEYSRLQRLHLKILLKVSYVPCIQMIPDLFGGVKKYVSMLRDVLHHSNVFYAPLRHAAGYGV